MRPGSFSYRGVSAAGAEYWKPCRGRGHDLLAMTKRDEAVLEGTLQPS